MTRSHTNKATFSPPFLHPPSPSTATNATPPMTDHMGEARGHGRRHTVGIQGTPAIFIFYLLFHLLRLDPQQPQHVPLHGKCADVPLLPPTTNPRCPSPAKHVPTSRTPERALVGTFWCSLFPSLISNTRKCPCGHFLVLAHLTSPLPVSNTRTCPHGHVLVLAHLPSLSPSSRTSPLPLPRLFTFLVYFYIRIVSFFVF